MGENLLKRKGADALDDKPSNSKKPRLIEDIPTRLISVSSESEDDEENPLMIVEEKTIKNERRSSSSPKTKKSPVRKKPITPNTSTDTSPLHNPNSNSKMTSKKRSQSV